MSGRLLVNAANRTTLAHRLRVNAAAAGGAGNADTDHDLLSTYTVSRRFCLCQVQFWAKLPLRARLLHLANPRPRHAARGATVALLGCARSGSGHGHGARTASYDRRTDHKAGGRESLCACPRGAAVSPHCVSSSMLPRQSINLFAATRRRRGRG